jgi:hypothetical protein
MPWAWLGLWRYWLRLLCLAVVLAGPIYVSLFVDLFWVRALMGLIAAASLASFFKRERCLLRLTWACRRFMAVSRHRITVYYNPVATTEPEAVLFLLLCRREREALARRFGSRLRGRLRVYLFPDHAPVCQISAGYGGFALIEQNAAVIGAYEHDQELIRHELTHLFAARWSRQAPALLSEGLAVWLQNRWGDQPIDVLARCLDRRHRPLSDLLSRQYFFDPPHRWECYLLAGSFTGYLIQRFGWDKYRRFYRRATARNFVRQFRAVFGREFADEEQAWREELRDSWFLPPQG